MEQRRQRAGRGRAVEGEEHALLCERLAMLLAMDQSVRVGNAVAAACMHEQLWQGAAEQQAAPRPARTRRGQQAHIMRSCGAMQAAGVTTTHRKGWFVTRGMRHRPKRVFDFILHR